MDLRIIDETEMDEATDAGIRRGLVECFPVDHEIFRQTRVWHGSAPSYSALIESGGRIVAHLGVVERKICTGIWK